MIGDSDGPRVGGGSPEDLPADARARLALVAQNRASVYRGLARGLGEPDDSLRAALADGSFAADLDAAVGWLGADARLYEAGLRTLAAPAVVRVEPSELASEYARLYTGPGRAAVSRFASQYLDEPGPDGRGPLRGPASDAVIAAYKDEGLAPRGSLHEPGDDLLTQLEFLAWVCAREAAEWLEGTPEEALRLRSATDRFLRKHCEPWWPAFAESVIEHSRLPIYGAMARILVGHLAAELGLTASAVRCEQDR